MSGATLKNVPSTMVTQRGRQLFLTEASREGIPKEVLFRLGLKG